MKRTTPKRFLRAERRAERSPTNGSLVTNTELHTVREIAKRTWALIGKRLVRRADLCRPVIIEAVLDGAYMETYGAKTLTEKQALRKFRRLPYNEQKLVLRPVFPKGEE